MKANCVLSIAAGLLMILSVMLASPAHSASAAVVRPPVGEYVSDNVPHTLYLPLLGKDYGPKRAIPGHSVTMTLLPKFMGVAVFNQVNTGAQQAASELQNPETPLYIGPPSPENSWAEQIRIVNEAIAAGQDAIMISNNAGDQIVPAVKLARDAGMTVVTWDSPIPSAEGEQLYVAPADFGRTGRLMADMALEILGVDGGQFAILSASAYAANQNAWIADMKETLKESKYVKLQLLEVVYGNDDPVLSIELTRSLVAKYSDMKLIMAPTSVGMLFGAHVLQELGRCGVEGQKPRVVISGLGLPSEMAPYAKNGCAPQFALWSFVDLGYLTYFATYMLHTGTLRGEKGEQFEAGRLGVYTIEKDPDRAAGLRVALGFKIFDKNNVDTGAR